MAKTKRRTIITAGRLVSAVVYTASLPRDEAHVRAEKLKCSSAARQQINLTHAWQKLEVLLAANFSFNDLVVTLTYDDEHLPPSRREAIKLTKKFLTQFRYERKKYDQILKYVYVTESKHGAGRLHHHVVINGTGQDYELIRALWTYGDNIQIEPIDVYGYEELAKYLTKEARELGSPNGARSWTPSKGLIRPQSVSDWVDDSLELVAPPGATRIAISSKQNSYGSYTYIKYMLPEPKMQRSRPQRKQKKNTDALLSVSEHCISFEKG